MASPINVDTKLYTREANKKLSMLDLLEIFYRHGSLRVSDLHLKVGIPPTYRMDGDLKPIQGAALDKATAQALAQAILSEEEFNTLQKQRAVDSSYITDKMQFRLNCFYENDGVALAIRALDPQPINLEEIGFPNNTWRDIIKLQWGLVMVTGITGAGKSTTIASLIDRIAQERACRIITLEDPIEYRLTSKKAVISQREVGRDVLGYAQGLRDCLREDPDVIFVGEMRDRESASWTLTAAETGHLVFSTLHTRDARGSISRVMDMFSSGQQDEVASQMSLGLSHIISQKLIPRQDGQGRLVAMEILKNSYAMANLIRLKKLEQIYTFLQTKTKDTPEERMITLEKSLAFLVRDGKVSPLEAEKWANHPLAFLDEMQQIQQQRQSTKS